MTSKERIYAAVQGLSYDRVPVTPIFMAWAANSIGHSYREFYLREDVLVKAQVAVTMQFNLDQLSAISDPWREANAYGMEFDYPSDGVGKPKEYFLSNLENIKNLKPLKFQNHTRTKQRIESVQQMAVAMGQTHSVLGWIEGPIAEYADLRGVQQTMMNLFDKPDAFHEAASIITDNAIEFALLQIKAGADMIGVGDAAASLLGPNLYKEHVFPYEKKLFGEIHSFGAMAKLHICGDISGIVGIMAQTGADVLDIDSMVPLDYAREQVGESKVLCGNFAPSEILLQGNPIDVAVAAKDCIQKAGKRFFLMPGCEVPPATTEENISAFCPCPGSLVFE